MSFPPDLHHVRDPGRNGTGPTGPRKRDPDLVSEIQRRLERASRMQQELAELREELLVQREKFRSSGNELRTQRIATGDAEVAFMNALRQYVNDLPPTVATPFREVEAARDKLGVMEADYLQAERDLGGSEWTFTDKENDVYQFELSGLFSDLFGPSPVTAEETLPLPPPSPPQEPLPSPIDAGQEYNAAKAEFDVLRKQFEALRLERARQFDDNDLAETIKAGAREDSPTNSDFTSRYFHVLDRITESEVKVHNLKQVSMQPDRRMSDPPHLKPPPNPFDAFVKAHTDTAVPTLSTDPAARRRIGEWLLDYMKNNAIQRTVYLGILKELGIVDPAGDPWEDRALEYWTTDSNEQPARLVQDKPPLTRFTSQCPNFDEESKSPLKFPSSDPSPSHSIPFFPPDLSPNDIYEPGSPLAGINTPDHVEVSSKPLVPQLRIRIKTPEAETNGVPVLKYDTPPDHNEGAGSIPSAPFHGLENNTAQLPIPSHNSSSSLTSRRHDSHQDLGALVVAEGVGPCTESTSPQQLLRPEDSVAISERPRATSNPECRRHVMRPNGSEIAESCSQKRMQNVDRTRKEGEPAMAESIRATSVSSFRSASPFSTLGPGPFHTANHPPISPGKQHCSTYLRVNSNIPGYHGPASEWSYPPEKQEKHWTERIRSHIKTRSSSSLFYRSSQYTGQQ